MDSISVLLTSCIVIVLLALTTIKYAYFKLKKQQFEENELANGNILKPYNGIREISRSEEAHDDTGTEILHRKEEHLANGTCNKDNNSLRPRSLPTWDEVDSSVEKTIENQKPDNSVKKESIKEAEKGGPDTDRNSRSGNVGKTKTTRIVYMNTNPTSADCLAENFIKEIEMSVVPNAEKSTLIIHAVQKQAQVPSPTEEDEKVDDFDFEEIPLPSVPEKEALNQEFLSNKNVRKSKRGQLFRSLRHRLSRKHSYSVKNPNVWETELEDKDVIKEKEDIILRCSQSVPEEEEGPAVQGSMRSNRSSASELSSTTTYTHESSTLVLESRENKVRKFFLVPPHLLQNGNWKKRGKKLHIFNEHTFVAKHLSSGTSCEICKVRIPFTLGKQGYQCRDCKIICHKECHIRTPIPCPKTSVYDFEFEYYRRNGTN